MSDNDEDLPADWSRNAAGRRRPIPSDYSEATSLADICARIEYENAVMLRLSGTPAAPVLLEIASALRRLDSTHLEWLSEPSAAAAAGRPTIYFRERFARWERSGIAKSSGPRSRFYLRAAVLAVTTTDSESDSRRPFVYVIRNTGTGHIKIGISLDPAARLAGLQTASPSTLELIATFPGGIEMERELHERFAAFRLAGEWFEESSEIREWIDTLKAKEDETC